MRRFIVSDIFGRTSALEEISQAIAGKLEIIDPYDAVPMNFRNEDQAYSFFKNEVGLDNYIEKLSNRIAAFPEKVSLLGFSIGASAIWKISSNYNLKNVSGAVCFYGSQISKYRNIIPQFPIQLIFPKYENHFSVSELSSELELIKKVKIHQSKFLHGFMNSRSINFNNQAYCQYLAALSNVSFNKCFQATIFGGA